MKISKNKIMITAIIVLCVAVAVLAAVLVIRKDKNKDNDDKFTPTIDSDSGEIGTGSNYSGGQQGIRIPGYPSITVDAFHKKLHRLKLLHHLLLLSFLNSFHS